MSKLPKSTQPLTNRTKMKLTVEQISKLEHKLIEAIKTSDVDFIENVLHDDLVFLAPNGQLITKEMDIASHKSKQMTVELLIPTMETCKIIDDIAISIVVYNTKGTMLGEPISGKFRYIRNWKLMNGDVKIMSGACIKIS
jgi:ketosteroid isomerase-like protein